jgi:hypothetical protein
MHRERFIAPLGDRNKTTNRAASVSHAAAQFLVAAQGGMTNRRVLTNKCPINGVKIYHSPL